MDKRWLIPGADTSRVADEHVMIRFSPEGSQLLVQVGAQALLLDSLTGDSIAYLEDPRADVLRDRAFHLVGDEVVSVGGEWIIYDVHSGLASMRADSACDSAQAVAPAFSEGKYWAACDERLILWDRYSREERVVETLFSEGRILSLGGAEEEDTIIGHVVFPGARGALWRFSADERKSGVDLNLQLKWNAGPYSRRQAMRFDTGHRVAFPSYLGPRIVNAKSGTHMGSRGTSGVVPAVAWDLNRHSLVYLTNPKQGSRKGVLSIWPRPPE
jgi:hypothetical protein